MRCWIVALTTAALGFAFTTSLANADNTAEEKEPKYTIKEVMKTAHKDGLLKKVVEGNGSDEEKKALLELYTALSLNKPPKGDEAAWKEKTAAILAAAKEVQAGGDTEALGKAVNCGGCHKEHK